MYRNFSYIIQMNQLGCRSIFYDEQIDFFACSHIISHKVVVNAHHSVIHMDSGDVVLGSQLQDG